MLAILLAGVLGPRTAGWAIDALVLDVAGYCLERARRPGAQPSPLRDPCIPYPNGLNRAQEGRPSRGWPTQETDSRDRSAVSDDRGGLMRLLDQPVDMRRSMVRGDLPGPRSAALLARQDRRESNARVYGRHLPIAVDEARGSFVRDVDGNVFIDFLTGAGVLSLGHNHPELVAAATGQLGLFVHGLDLPTPAKDAFTAAQLSMLPGQMADRVKMHFCGPTGANAVDAAIKLCKTATGRGEVISFQGGFHGTTHAGMALSGLVANKAPVANGIPGVHFFPFSNCADCPLGLSRAGCATNCVELLERSLRDPNGGIPLPAAVIVEMVQGEGGVVAADPEFVRRLRL